MTRISSGRIAPQSGTALALKQGQTLRIIDPGGEQVCDLMAFDAHDLDHWLSSGRSLDYAERIYLTTGDLLYSNRSVPMLEIVRDDVGRHDFLLTPCSPQTFEILYDDAPEDHPSCFANLVEHLAPYGIGPDAIPTTFNVFMNVTLDGQGRLSVEPPLSKPGDVLEVRARCDLIVGLTSCSAEQSNNGSFGPIDYEVL